MSSTWAVLVGCLAAGLVAGPLVNVLIDRVPGKEPLLPLRARCPVSDALSHVATSVVGGWARLVAGRCPACGARLPRRYPAVELATVGLFGAAALRFGADWALPAYLVLFAALLTVSLIDLEHFIIPNRVVYPTVAVSIPLLALAAALQHGWTPMRHALLGAALAWSLLVVVHLVSPRGMGFGDVRLAFVLGLFLGWLSLGHVLTGLFLGFALGAVIGIALVGLGLRSRKDHIPFGPFLAAGATLAVFVGSAIMRWYVGE